MPHATLAELPPQLRRQREETLDLARGGASYRSLDRGFRYLACVRGDGEVALALLRQLVQLGLGGPARELLDQRADLNPAAGEAIELRRIVAAAPTGRVNPKDVQATFIANAAALLNARPELAATVEAMRSQLPDLQLFRSSDGLVHLSRRPAGSLRMWIPALTDDAEVLDQQLQTHDLRRPTVVIGAALNRVVELIEQATRATRPDPGTPLFLLEPDLFRMAGWLASADRTALLQLRRVHLMTGPNAVAELEAFLRDEDDAPIPRLQFRCHVPAEVVQAVTDAVQRIHAERTTALVQLIESPEPGVFSASGSAWADRLQPGARILGITSRFSSMMQHSMRDFGLALTAMGYEFHQHMEQDDDRAHNLLSMRRAIARFKPTLIIQINHLRYEAPLAYGEIPILTWIQDPMDNLLSPKAGASLGPHDFVFGYFRDHCVQRYGYPPRQFLDQWWFPVSTATFHDAAPDQDALKRFGCDMAYVGHCHGTPQTSLQAALARFPHRRTLIETIHRDVMELHRRGAHPSRAGAEELVRAAALRLGVNLDHAEVDSIAGYAALRSFDITFRHETLTWVAKWATRTGRRFRIYGRGWESHPVFSRWAAGPVDHGEPLRLALRCATFSLQTIPSGFIHQRTFESLASGSLVLSRQSPWDFHGLPLDEFRQRTSTSGGGESIPSTFDLFPHLERVLFNSAESFEALVESLLASESQRLAVLSEFRQQVLERCTYASVAPVLLEQVRSRLRDGERCGVRG